jgi:prophage regulatory protein
MNNIQDPLSERLIRIAEVKKLTGLSAASIYRKIATRDFPRQVSIGATARAWPLSEIQAWINRLMSERDGASSTAERGQTQI